MGESVKVSLILTTYNCIENLKRTLESIEMQDYPKVEVIIVDGHSTDGTVDVIGEYETQSKYKVKWLSEKDQGIYDAMNKGYRLSTGEVIAFFNDLFLSEHAVRWMIEAISAGSYEGSHADLVYATDDKVIRYWKMGKGNIRQGWMPGHPTLYLKREVYEKYGLYDISYHCSADYEFMVRILRNNDVRLAYVPTTILRMYYGGTSTNSMGSYWLSVKEGHRALVSNGIKNAWLIDLKRTLRVLWQFVRKDYHHEK